MIVDILLEGMEFYSFHGCNDEEKQIGGKFEVSLKIKVDIGKASEHDDINKTLNYQDVYNLVKSQIAIKSNIIENVAYRILKEIKSNFDNIKEIEIKFSKINPPINAKIEKISVIMKYISRELMVTENFL